MPTIAETIAELARSRNYWEMQLRRAKGRASASAAGTSSDLVEEHDFGSNPGRLKMLSYVPRHLAANPALVVVLHGCTQTASAYSSGAGWSTLAERYGFALLLPEQRPGNNLNRCFHWFLPAHARRDEGEALSIRQMIEAMVIRRGIDRRRVFVTGLSAGGAMASVMLACYPEVFAAGAIIAGLPYGAACNVQQAFENMRRCPSRAGREWGDLVRGASPGSARWPRISVWHGTADRTVIPSNAGEIIKQWTDVHCLPAKPSAEVVVDGYPRKVWVDAAGHERVEFYGITHMAHGAPLATGSEDDECGNAGPFLLEVGISSSYHIAKFFGLAIPASRSAASETKEAAKAPGGAADSRALATHVFDGEVLDREAESEPRHTSGDADAFPFSRFSPIDVEAVITSALKAAGLMRGR